MSKQSNSSNNTQEQNLHKKTSNCLHLTEHPNQEHPKAFDTVGGKRGLHIFPLCITEQTRKIWWCPVIVPYIPQKW